MHRSHRLGFGLSLLLHLGLLAGLWLWQRDVTDSAVPGEVVPVQLTMFAQAAPAPIAAAAPPPPQAEPVVEKRAIKPFVPPVEHVVEKAAERPVEPQLTKPPSAAITKPVIKATPKPIPSRPPTKSRPVSAAVDKPAAADPVVETAVTETPPIQATAAAMPASAPRRVPQIQVREAYKAAILTAIEHHKFYPNRARRRHVEGEVQVAFRIQADGSLRAIRLAVSSGSRALDEAALAALRKVNRLPPLPEVLGMQEWEVAVPIAYKLN